MITRRRGRADPDRRQVDYDFTICSTPRPASRSAERLRRGSVARIGVGLDEQSLSVAFECATVGSRVAVVSTWEEAKDAFDADAARSFDDDATVVVVDRRRSDGYLGKADGFNQLPVDGMPTVVTAVDGTPGITVPAPDQPDDHAASRRSRAATAPR